MISLLLFPFRLALSVVLTPLRVARLPVKVFGLRGALALGVGVGVGVLVAPGPGAETRQRLRQLYEDWQAGRDPLPWSGPSSPAVAAADAPPPVTETY